MFILQAGHTETVELLLKIPGIDVNSHTNYKRTPLHWPAKVSYNFTKHIHSAIYVGIF